jgi:hypothetical protein
LVGGVSLLLMRFGHATLVAGRAKEAFELAHRALNAARTHKERGNEAWGLKLLGDVAGRGDTADLVAAAQHYTEANTLAEARGMRPLVAHCHAGFARLHRRTGKRGESDEHLAAATWMYRAMGMTYWLEKAEETVGALAWSSVAIESGARTCAPSATLPRPGADRPNRLS